MLAVECGHALVLGFLLLRFGARAHLLFTRVLRDTGFVELVLEASGHRDICIYPREPHVLVAQAPTELFLDPSHTYRLDLQAFAAGPATSGAVVREVRDALTSSAAEERGLFRPEVVDRLLADPNGSLTPLGGNPLWQLALLEMWLQGHAL